ncbi:gem-associated protein 5-like [Danio aesculapii]|uniref:gem-associated protein 5-like n=1 Tax=Danio aesculapii TaxID=1142201 RepID=UPI0024BF1195|nr:gem-associated protein 5-like [Danio aesculapii]
MMMMKAEEPIRESQRSCTAKKKLSRRAKSGGSTFEAISLLKSHQFYREAIALARARLQPDDPVLKDLYMSWAAVLEKDGHYATAAKCYLATDSSFDAAKVIGKKGDVTSLKTAAHLAQITGETELAHSLSLRCAKDLIATQDWKAAQDVLRTQDSLLGHRLVFSVNEILTQRLADTDVVSWSSSSSHWWSSSREEVFFSAVFRVWQREFGVDPADVHKLQTLHQQLKAIENPPLTTTGPVKQLLSHISLDVTLCALSELLCDWSSVVEQLLRALSRASEAGNFTLMAELSLLLFPHGLESVALYKQKLDPSDERSLSISQSVEAFVCYPFMYEKWWTSTSTNDAISNGHHLTLNDGDEEKRNGEAQSDGFWKILLSEAHADLQANQRAIAEIQKRVSSLIQQHSRCKDPETSLEGSAGGTGSESLSVLTAQVAEHHKALAAVPEHIRKHPFPDVMECCIVLLHMEKHFNLIPQHICSEATALLRKYGTAESLSKAVRRLIH